jgi:hypothetical protein
MWTRKSFPVVALAFCFMLVGTSTVAQQNQKPITNDDTITMTNSGLPESVILGSIEANPTDFDLSPSALIGLKKAGVTPKVMDAMLASAINKKSGMASSPMPTAPADGAAAGISPASLAGIAAAMKSASGAGASSSASAQVVGQVSVTLLQNGARKDLASEKTFIVQTKSKATSLAGLSSDTALHDGLQAGTNQAWYAAASHGHGSVANAMWDSSGVVTGILSRRNKPSHTYVWALSGVSSSMVTGANQAPAFEVNYSAIAGINANEFEPAIVKLTPSYSTWRLVGATEGKAESVENSTPDWQAYSAFVEDRVPTQTRKLSSGHAQISTTSRLAPGEYGLVLRPISRSKKFSGPDVAANRGEGMLFNSVWSFEVK